MKSVKNFFIERINSIDHSDNSSTGTGGSVSGSLRNSFKKRSHKFEKLKVAAAATSTTTTDNITDIGAAAGDGNASSPSVISIAGGSSGQGVGGDPSPSPSATQTPTFAVPESSLSTTSDTGSNSASASVSQSISGGNMAQSPTSNAGHDTNDDSATTPTTSPFNFNTPHHHTTTTVTSSLSTPVIKPQKSRRKISLPWFRQQSSAAHATLSRQHTIDSPGSFRILRQTSNYFKV